MDSRVMLPDQPEGSIDQACNECKRRKGRCDKVLPECGPCARNKRHCLYERHSRTPLTRKHLTLVEERLRQTEVRLRHAERRAKEVEAELAKALGDNARLMVSRSDRQQVLDAQVAQEAHPDSSSTFEGLSGQASGSARHEQAFLNGYGARASEYHLELPPAEDFSWDEQTALERQLSPHDEVCDDPEASKVLDGMASLSVEDTGTGYLGVASGAAMLKLMLDGADDCKAPRPRTHMSRTAPVGSDHHGWVPTPVFWERQIGMINLDAAIDAYFSCYHLAYPIVHEPTFRAQYAQVIPRPDGRSWNALAYIIGAIGLFSTATTPVTQDWDLFEASKSNISIASLESGNTTLVQALTLMSNYLQKRNKPNSGYNYLGLALHMAISLGLHKEFSNWHIAPLVMENRRRTWWTLYAFFSGAMITFGRPVTLPSHGVEVSLPLNVDDRDLTHASIALPPPTRGMTPYSAVASQARFHMATNDLYARIICRDFPSAAELLRLDNERIATWHTIWSEGGEDTPERYRLPRMMMEWRYRNFRIIMFRFHLIKHVLQSRKSDAEPANEVAIHEVIDRCLSEAEASIASIHAYWNNAEHIVMASWYGLYFIFQASLIPTIMLRNNPTAPKAASWRAQLLTVLAVTQSMVAINAAAAECHELILRLCGKYLAASDGTFGPGLNPVEESPETQLSGLQGMMWPGIHVMETDALTDSTAYVQDDSWMTFLQNMGPDNLSTSFDHV